MCSGSKQETLYRVTAVKTTEPYGNSLTLLAPWSERDYAYYFLVHCVFLDIFTVIIIIYQVN